MKRLCSLVMMWSLFLINGLQAFEYDDASGTAQFFLRADYLYWTAKQEGLKYTNEPTDILTAIEFTDTSLVAPDFDWNSGFRIGAGYAVPCTGWVADLEYTQFNNFAKGHRFADDTDGFFPTLTFDAADDSFVVFPEDYVTAAKSTWNFNSYIFDIVGTYPWSVCDCLTITPIIGVRNAWINQKVQGKYFGGLFEAGPCDVSLHSKFYGVGPMFGIAPVLHLGYGLSIYAEAAASFLFSWWDINQHEYFLDTEVAHFRKKPTNMRWSGDLNAGVNWVFCPDWCAAIKLYTLDVGFDFMYFSQQYAFEHGENFTLPKKSKFLMMYGIHVAGGIAF